MDIDFIKKCVKKAEGFEWFDKDILRFKYHNLNYDWIVSGSPGIKAWCFYPLLLQRAIEGINRDLNNPYKINTKHNNIEVYHNQLGMMDGWIRQDQDEAKEQALKYIREQINND